jgi:hypothetical protein
VRKNVKERILLTTGVIFITYFTLLIPFYNEISSIKKKIFVFPFCTFTLPSEWTTLNLQLFTIVVISLVSSYVEYKKMSKPLSEFEIFREKNLTIIFDNILIHKLTSNYRDDLILTLYETQPSLFDICERFRILYLRPVYNLASNKNKYINTERSRNYSVKNFFNSINKNLTNSSLSYSYFCEQPIISYENEFYDVSDVKRTDINNNIKFSLSIPIHKWYDDKNYKYVGALRVYTINEETAKELYNDKNEVTRYFSDWAELCSLWIE